MKSLYKPSADKDVTESSEYHFSSFAGTIWNTKTKTAITEGKRYTGAPQINLLPPDRFDPSEPNYIEVKNLKIIAVLPPGTRLRMNRLLQDQGAWGGIQVEGIILDGTNAQRRVIVQGSFFCWKCVDQGSNNQQKLDWRHQYAGEGGVAVS